MIRFPDETERSLAEVIADAPSDVVIEMAPGRFKGPLVIRKPLTLRGAGDLTRIHGGARVITVDVPDDAGKDGRASRVVLESLLLEGGEEQSGGIIALSGRVRLHNLHIQNCTASAGGGAIHLAGGELDATRLRAHDVSGDRGGAVWASGSSVLTVRDSQISHTEARFGGALAIEDGARVILEGLTIGRSRATTPSGGQAIYVGGSIESTPTLILRRVRFEDAPLGMPLVVDPKHPAEVNVTECDMPRVVLGVPGVVDGGENHWR